MTTNTEPYKWDYSLSTWANKAAEDAHNRAQERYTCRCCGSDVDTPFPVDYCNWCRGGVAGMGGSR